MDTSSRPAWRFSEVSRNVHRFEVKLAHVGQRFSCLLQSDVHWDNPHCDRPMWRRHLDEAAAIGAPVLDAGDFFCAMQGKWDSRANKNDIRPEHQSGKYLDALVRTASDALAPYRDLLTVRAMGNHESSILKHHETHLGERLVERLRAAGAPHVSTGGFSGFVVFNLTWFSNRRKRVVLYYHHGYGGGGPVTRGVIQTNRQAAFLSDADVVWNGHTHDAWQVPIARIRLSLANKIEHCRQLHVRTPGYKEEYADGYSGWHVERGAPPKPVGAAWLDITLRDADSNHIDVQVREAI